MLAMGISNRLAEIQISSVVGRKILIAGQSKHFVKHSGRGVVYDPDRQRPN